MMLLRIVDIIFAICVLTILHSWGQQRKRIFKSYLTLSFGSRSSITWKHLAHFQTPNPFPVKMRHRILLPPSHYVIRREICMQNDQKIIGQEGTQKYIWHSPVPGNIYRWDFFQSQSDVSHFSRKWNLFEIPKACFCQAQPKPRPQLGWESIIVQLGPNLS